MSIYSNNLEICLVTEFIEEKMNEIPTGPKLLYLLNLENIILIKSQIENMHLCLEKYKD